MASRCLGFATLPLTPSILVLEISPQFECGGDLNGIVLGFPPLQRTDEKIFIVALTKFTLNVPLK